MRTFLKFYSHKAIHEINNEDLIRFNNEYILRNNLSISFQNQIVNAIKLFFRKIENTQLEIDLIHCPKREKKMPNVLSKEEVKQILNDHTNIKHKAMLNLIYTCGLRRSELLNLRIHDVDSVRHLLIIKNAKGKKDKVVPISDKLIELLSTYYKMYKPSTWLFEGQNKNEPYSEKSLQIGNTMAGSSKILQLEELLKCYIKDLKGEFVSKNSGYEGDICNIIQEFTKTTTRYWDCIWKSENLYIEFKKGKSIWLDLVRYSEIVLKMNNDAKKKNFYTFFLFPIMIVVKLLKLLE